MRDPSVDATAVPTPRRDRAAALASVATGVWALLVSVVGYVVLTEGPACNALWHDDYQLGRGARAVCGGDGPITPVLLVFLATAFVATAALVLRTGGGERPSRRLLAAVALLPVVVALVLRGVTLVP